MGLMFLGCGIGGLAAVLTLLFGGGAPLALAIYSGVGACTAFGGAWTIDLRSKSAKLKQSGFHLQHHRISY